MLEIIEGFQSKRKCKPIHNEVNDWAENPTLICTANIYHLYIYIEKGYLMHKQSWKIIL